MIDLVSEKITRFFIAKNFVHPKQSEMCKYSVSKRILSIVTYCTIIFICAHTIGLIHILFFAWLATLLRKKSGGYHADSRLKCFILSNTIFIFSSYILLPIISGINVYFTLFIFLVGLLILFLFAPVVHPNLPLTEEEKQANKKSLFKRLIAVTTFFILSEFALDLHKIADIIVITVAFVAITVIIQKTINRRKKNEND